MPGPLPLPGFVRTIFRGSPGYSHYVFAFAFLVRLIVLTRLASSPFLLPAGSDMHFYDEWAKQILHGQWTDHQAFYGLPLYPFLLAFLYRVFGYGPFVPGFFQACLDAGTAVLIYKITVRVVRGTAKEVSKSTALTGIAAAWGWCFFVPAQAYSAVLMPTAGAVFVSWLLVWEIVRTNAAPSRLRCLALGLLIGVTAMGVATVLFLIPLLLFAIVVRPVRAPLASRATAAAFLFLGFFVGTSPCWIHNYFVAREPVFLSAHGGINLWLGNNPEATGYPRFPGFRAGQSQLLRDSIDVAQAAAGRVLKRSEVSHYWSDKARNYIAAHPLAWLKLMTRKIANFWNAFEYDDLGVVANLLGHRILFPGPRFGLIAALALPGVFLSFRASATSRWVAAAILLQMAAILPIFVTERYRLVGVPGLLVLAASGLAGLWHDCSTSRYRWIGAYLAVLTGALTLITIPRGDPGLWAIRPYNAARESLESGDWPRAEKQLSLAYSYAPDNPEINLALGNLRLAQGNRAAAVAFYAKVLRIEPTHKSALNNLGVMALEEAKFSEAKEYFRRALKQEPGNAKTHYLMAKAELALGDIEEAKAAIAQALNLEPDRPEYQQLQEQIEHHGQ